MQVTWTDILDFPGFAVSTDGRVSNIRTSRLLSTRMNQQGFLMVNLTRDRRLYTRSVSMLVAKAFVPQEGDPEVFNSVIHLDNDRRNCHMDNLMWRPRWFARRYNHQFTRTPYKGAVYLRDTDEVFDNIRDAAVKYGLLEENVFADLWNKEGVFPYGYLFEKYKE